jgi:lipopolysaccharide/colanic/teichoic acid biosynthesis glycosyltransferase
LQRYGPTKWEIAITSLLLPPSGLSTDPLPAIAIANEEKRVLRALDIVLVLLLILALLPLLAIVAGAIRLTTQGSIFFSHSRIGRDGKSFGCLKFRTMAPDAEERLARILARDPVLRLEWELSRKLKDDPRVTRIGKLLRRWSLDELPQLFNVLRGEMSLVGPRPIILGEVALYKRYFVDYSSVRPGITGLWQISGRNDVSYRRRVALDVCFARRQSLTLYLSILLRTPACVLGARGSY